MALVRLCQCLYISFVLLTLVLNLTFRFFPTANITISIFYSRPSSSFGLKFAFLYQHLKIRFRKFEDNSYEILQFNLKTLKLREFVLDFSFFFSDRQNNYDYLFENSHLALDLNLLFHINLLKSTFANLRTIVSRYFNLTLKL